MPLLFFSSDAKRRALVREVWATVSPGSPYLAVDDVPDAALQGQSGLFKLMLIDLDDAHASSVLLRFMRRHPGAARVLTYGGHPRSDWSQLEAYLKTFGFHSAEPI